MERKRSEIDFSNFIGQTVKDVNTEKNVAFGLTFDAGFLTIECPWRLTDSKAVLIGSTDITSSIRTREDAKKIMFGKTVVGIVHYEPISDLVVQFEDGYTLELFHASTYFEGWQLGADDGFLLISMPGGEYCENE